jgi:hypothetical protein
MMIIRGFVFVFVCSLLFSCKRDLKQGQKSLEGHWEIDEIISYYPQGDANAQERVEERASLLGYFTFSEDGLVYEYMRNDTLYSETTTWQLETEKVNSGFTKVRVFTLVLANGQTYECIYGDQTKNAEKDANEITLSNTGLVDFNLVNSYELHLKKK